MKCRNPRCQNYFVAGAFNSKYCSPRCQRAAYKMRRSLRTQTGQQGIPYYDDPNNDPGIGTTPRQATTLTREELFAQADEEARRMGLPIPGGETPEPEPQIDYMNIFKKDEK